MPAIGHSHLKLWSRGVGMSEFGQLIRRLIWAHAAKMYPSVKFLSGEANNENGWDGEVEFRFDEGEDAVHRSVWEISVQEKYEKKIEDDYKAAVNKSLPSGWKRSKVFYVAATIADKITKTKKEQIVRRLVHSHGNPWAAIVILDVDDFVHWVEKSPSVESWLTVEMNVGLGRYGRAIEHAWQTWAKETKPNVSEALVLAGRDPSPLVQLLRFETAKSITVQSDSPQEALAIVYCAIKTLNEQDADALLSTALVVSNVGEADELALCTVTNNEAPLTILFPLAARKAENLIDKGHNVIKVIGRQSHGTSALHFARSGVTDFKSALTSSMKLDPAIAELEARTCGCSVSVWKIHKLYESGVDPSDLPEWTKHAHNDCVVPAVLLGGWNKSSQPDQKAVQTLVTTKPQAFFDKLQQFILMDDPLLEVVDAENFVIAPTAAFAFVARHITGTHLENFEAVCNQIFKQIDPEVAAHWAGSRETSRIHRRTEELSGWLLDGLAESLLRIALLDEDLKKSGALGSHRTGQEFVDKLISTLPTLKEHPRLLASLDRRLPILMEAAPIPFFDALESLLQGAPEQIGIWLSDEGGIFGRAYHTGLLWGLETLAWIPEYFEKATLLLASLAEADPGGRLANRPGQSLREIFLPWHPQTLASLDERVSALRNIQSNSSKAGWKLLLDLLPGHQHFASPTSKPRMRGGEKSFQIALSRSEVISTYQAFVALTLDVAGSEIAKLTDLIGHYSDLSPDHKLHIEKGLSESLKGQISSEQMQAVWDALHKLTTHHRSFSGAGWALSSVELDRLEAIQSRFQSSNLVDKNRWLFDEQMPDTGRNAGEFDEWTADIEKRRQYAVTEILSATGEAGIHRLILSARFSFLVANAVAKIASSPGNLIRMMETWRLSGTQKDLWAMQSASVTRLSIDGKRWIEDLVSHANSANWSPTEIGTAILDFPDTRETFDLVKSMGNDVSDFYWKKRYAFLRLEEEDDSLFREAIAELISHDRAIDIIDLNRLRLQRLSNAEVLNVIDNAITQMLKDKSQIGDATFEYDLKELFKWLRDNDQNSIEEIAKREYVLLPFLISRGRDDQHLALHEVLSRSPGDFINILCDLFKPRRSSREGEGINEQTVRNRAHAAFEIFSSWKLPPGKLSDGTIDIKLLNEWVDLARDLAKQRDRVEVGDEKIGSILFYLGTDPVDGAWPHSALRDLLERVKSSDIETGLRTEAFNSRGVTMRGPYDGGNQERDLEEIWRGYAKVIGGEWPRSRRICLSMAESWKRMGEGEDAEVTRRRSRESRG